MIDSKFKVGDFARLVYKNTSTKFKVHGIDSVCDYSDLNKYHNILLTGEWDSYNDEPDFWYEENCELWTPYHNEICWFWDSLDNLQLRVFDKMDEINPHLFQPKDSVMGFKYCEPFFGSVPTVLQGVVANTNV